MFEGWYWDAACTERLKSSSSGSVTFTNSSNFTVSGNGRTLTSYPSAAAAEAGTKIVIYAKFVKTVPDFDWSTLGVTPMDEGKSSIIFIISLQVDSSKPPKQEMVPVRINRALLPIRQRLRCSPAIP